MRGRKSQGAVADTGTRIFLVRVGFRKNDGTAVSGQGGLVVVSRVEKDKQRNHAQGTNRTCSGEKRKAKKTLSSRRRGSGRAHKKSRGTTAKPTKSHVPKKSYPSRTGSTKKKKEGTNDSVAYHDYFPEREPRAHLTADGS